VTLSGYPSPEQLRTELALRSDCPAQRSVSCAILPFTAFFDPGGVVIKQQQTLALCTLLTLVACSKSRSGGALSPSPIDPQSIPSTPVAGTIDGTAWTLGTGIAEAVSNDATKISLKFSDASVARPCDASSWPINADSRALLTEVDAKTGVQERSFASGGSITIVVDKQGQISDNRIGEGVVDLSEVTRAKVTGKIGVRYDNDTASGTFAIRRCADPFADPKTDFQADTTGDADLVGTWTGDELIAGTSSGMTWTLTFAADGTAKAQLKIGDDVVEDADETWKTDGGVDPKRLLRTVTTARTDTNGLEESGSSKYCVYGLVADKLTLDCHPSAYSVELPTAENTTLILTKS
jgi:hypothetical protein